MNIKAALKELEASKIYNDFIKENPSYYLASFFVTYSNGNEQAQFGFYEKKSDMMVTFDVDPIQKNEADHVFKKERYVKKLNMEKVKISLNDTRRQVEKILKKNYSGELVTKSIIILQKLDKQVYNFTLVTRSLSIINIHINAETGKIESQAKKPIMSLAK